jgi:hypothetical protein
MRESEFQPCPCLLFKHLHSAVQLGMEEIFIRSFEHGSFLLISTLDLDTGFLVNRETIHQMAHCSSKDAALPSEKLAPG